MVAKWTFAVWFHAVSHGLFRPTDVKYRCWKKQERTSFRWSGNLCIKEIIKNKERKKKRQKERKKDRKRERKKRK